MVSNLLVWGMLVIGILIVLCIGGFALWRKQKAYRFVVEKDYRNPQAGRKKWYAVPDMGAKAIRLYNNLVTPWPAKNVPLFDINAFADSDKTVHLVRGVTGRPADDMLVPMGLTLLSQAAAFDYAKDVSNAVGSLMQLYDAVDENHLRIGDTCEYVVDNKTISGKITKVDYTGAVFSYIESFSADGSPNYERYLLGVKELASLTVTTPQENKDLLDVVGYSDFFSTEWVMKTFGIRRVEDANIVTIPQKTAVASLASKANEFVINRSGFLEKHSGLVIGCILIFIVGISVYIILNGANTFYAGITSDVHGLISAQIQQAGSSGYGINGTILPKG